MKQRIVQRGVAVPIRIDDPGQALAKNEGKPPGTGLLVEILDPGSFFRLVPLVYQDSAGRDHQIIIPFNTPL